jgi:hypothetical protein
LHNWLWSWLRFIPECSQTHLGCTRINSRRLSDLPWSSPRSLYISRGNLGFTPELDLSSTGIGRESLPSNLDIIQIIEEIKKNYLHVSSRRRLKLLISNEIKYKFTINNLKLWSNMLWSSQLIKQVQSVPSTILLLYPSISAHLTSISSWSILSCCTSIVFFCTMMVCRCSCSYSFSLSTTSLGTCTSCSGTSWSLNANTLLAPLTWRYAVVCWQIPILWKEMLHCCYMMSQIWTSSLSHWMLWSHNYPLSLVSLCYQFGSNQ